jgi:NADPH-dependent glutamate synthase beta subunit-like oxidoreductase
VIGLETIRVNRIFDAGSGQPEYIPGTEVMPADSVILAIGQAADGF